MFKLDPAIARNVFRSPWMWVSATCLALSVASAAYHNTPSQWASATFATVCTVLAWWIIYRLAVLDAKWAQRDLERDLREEMRDREDRILDEDRDNYLRTGVRSPAAQAIVDRRNAEIEQSVERARQERQERLRAAGYTTV